MSCFAACQQIIQRNRNTDKMLVRTKKWHKIIAVVFFCLPLTDSDCLLLVEEQIREEINPYDL